MTDQPAVDIEDLRKAIGRESSASDIVTVQHCLALNATLDKDAPPPQPGDAAPLSIHWCLAPPTVPMRAIGADGHPQRGGFLPAVPLPRRMWAGGRLEFLDPIRVGDRVTRLSRIEDVRLKQGSSGPLCFVTVRHQVSTPRGPAINERQDIVYRGAETGAAPAKPAVPPPGPRAEWSRSVMADPVLLFRYSALTFNGHRIHYDRAYATGEEGYPGLVVHGPLQATLLLTLAGELRGMPKTFDFRGTSPLFDGAALTVNAAPSEAGLELWIAGADGRTTMSGSATW
ncbi:FAS1-like dehydratase domain-containing protein [Paracoccus versutus]|uniref:FAS1-like dehydratase domain-containing protein n=1 Tax=Paracoccus versutus TaxID=34007 RepID=UPI000DF74A57|nr:MaoC family dehydratase N-terminal domain-containing protein [Paracoccus versutus]RDD72020.1 protein dehydratase [Paracoccus versutus]